MRRNQFRALAAIAALLAVALVAMPALGVDPSGSPSAEPSAAASAAPSSAASAEPTSAASLAPSAAPSASSAAPAPSRPRRPRPRSPTRTVKAAITAQSPTRPPRRTRVQRRREHPVTLTGIVGHPSEDDFTLVVGITVYDLSVGPPWWWGDASPLAAVVGKTVTIDGEQEEGSNEVDVLAIDGKAIREPGRPPWAGGWKVVGSKHPGMGPVEGRQAGRQGPRPGLGAGPGQQGRRDPLTPARGSSLGCDPIQRRCHRCDSRA